MPCSYEQQLHSPESAAAMREVDAAAQARSDALPPAAKDLVFGHSAAIQTGHLLPSDGTVPKTAKKMQGQLDALTAKLHKQVSGLGLAWV